LALVMIGEEELKAGALTSGIILAAGLMVKVSVMAGFVPAAIVLLYLSIYGGKKGGARWKDATVSLSAFVIPIVIIQLIWWQYAGKFETPLSSLEFEFGLVVENGALLARLAEAAWNYVVSWKMPMTLLAVFGLAYGAARREFRPLAIGLALYCIFYGIGLFQLYAFRFGPYEVAELQSLQRYMRVPLRLIQIFGLTLFALLITTKLAGTNFDVRRYFTGKGFVALCAILVILVGGFQLFAIRYGLTDIRDRFSMSPERLEVVTELQNDRQKLEKIIIDLGLVNPLIALIAQGDDGYSARVVSFLSLPDSREKKQMLYRVGDGYSWGEQPKNIWMQKTTIPKLMEYLGGADIIWVHRPDEWIDPVLNLLSAGCNPRKNWRFIVKRKRGDGYSCKS
jgi:hypothetical protein